MDRLHKPDKKFFVTKAFDLTKFAADAVDLTDQFEMPVKNLTDQAFFEETSKALSLSLLQVEEMDKVVNVNNLRCAKDVSQQCKLDMPTAPILSTLKVQQATYANGTRSIFYDYSSGMEAARQLDLDIVDALKDDEHSSSVDLSLTSGELVLTVIFLCPTNTWYTKKSMPKRQGVRIDYIYRVLGSQVLTQLRDAIQCPSDKAPVDGALLADDSKSTLLAKQVFPGAFMYINGTFYNDTRQPNATDLSEPIIKWAARRPDELGPFQTKDMQNASFAELHLRLGQPYVYVHQGCCEHVIIFSDVRLLNDCDPLSRGAYPIQLCRNRKHWTRCNLCKSRLAEWRVTLEADSPSPNLLLCTQCYHSFCSDGKGTWIRRHMAVAHHSRCFE